VTGDHDRMALKKDCRKKCPRRTGSHGWTQPQVTRGRHLLRALPVLVVLWVVLILYPNPLSLAVSVQRLADPRVDPAAVQTLAESLPSEATAIEKAVLDSVPYSYDWKVYAMPWYFPTVDEVLEKGRGDCKARAIVLPPSSKRKAFHTGSGHRQCMSGWTTMAREKTRQRTPKQDSMR